MNKQIAQFFQDQTVFSRKLHVINAEKYKEDSYWPTMQERADVVALSAMMASYVHCKTHEAFFRPNEKDFSPENNYGLTAEGEAELVRTAAIFIKDLDPNANKPKKKSK